jgi:hypothetical protein
MVLEIGPERCTTLSPLGRAREDPPIPTLCLVWDCKVIGMLTGIAPDCRSKYVGHTPAFGWSETTLKSNESGRGGRVLQSPDFVHNLVKMYVNISFFYILNEIQKYLRKISARIGIFSFGT